MSQTPHFPEVSIMHVVIKSLSVTLATAAKQIILNHRPILYLFLLFVLVVTKQDRASQSFAGQIDHQGEFVIDVTTKHSMEIFS